VVPSITLPALGHASLLSGGSALAPSTRCAGAAEGGPAQRV